MIDLVLSNGPRYSAALTRLDTTPRYRFAWDDEISDYDFKCRTQHEEFTGPPNPPAVIPFYSIRDERDRQRINLEKDSSWRWKDTIVTINGGRWKGLRAWGYL